MCSCFCNDFHTSLNFFFPAVGTSWLNKDVESFLDEQKCNALTRRGNKKLFELPLKNNNDLKHFFLKLDGVRIPIETITF